MAITYSPEYVPDSIPTVSPAVPVAARLEAALRVAVPTWVLAYFFVPNTLWERLSPGGQIVHWSASLPYRDFFLVAAGLGTIAVAVWGRPGRGGIRLRETPLWLPLLIYLLPIVFLLLLQSSPFEQARPMSSLLVAIASGLIGAAIAGQASVISTTVCLLGTMQSLYALYLQRYGINTLLSGETLRAGGTFDHPNHVYTLMLVGLPLSVSMAFQARTQLARFAFLFASSAMFAALLLTWFRGGMVAIAVGITWMTFQYSKDKKATAAVAISLLLAVGLVFQSRQGGAVNAASAQRSNAGRLLLWSEGVNLFQQHWLTGVGVGAVAIPTTTATKTPNTPLKSVSAEPKNVALLWADEMGVSGILLFGLFIVTIGRILRGNLSDPVTVGIAAAWISLLVAGFSDTPFGIGDRYVGNVLFGLLIGATFLIQRQNRQVEAPADSTSEK